MNLLNLYLHLLLIDVKQAYKSINRIYLYKILKAFGIPKKLVNLIKMMLQYSMEKWKFGDNWHAFGTERGLWCNVYSTVKYCIGEGDKEYRDQSEWNNF